MPSGTVVWLQRTPYRGAPCVPEEAAFLREDWGVDGDRHARPGSSRQVVLVHAEVLDDLGLPYGATREQLTVAGLPDLATHDRVVLGDAVVELVRARVPCRIMEGVRPGLEAELHGRGGWCGRVTSSGIVRTGDPVTVEPAAASTAGGDPEWLRQYLEAITAWEESPVSPAGADGWTFPERLAHLIAWDERGATRIDAVAGGAPDEGWSGEDIDAFNAAAVARLTGGEAPPDLWTLHDTWSTAVVDAARRHPTEAEPWVRALTAHYREHT